MIENLSASADIDADRAAVGELRWDERVLRGPWWSLLLKRRPGCRSLEGRLVGVCTAEPTNLGAASSIYYKKFQVLVLASWTSPERPTSSASLEPTFRPPFNEKAFTDCNTAGSLPEGAKRSAVPVTA